MNTKTYCVYRIIAATMIETEWTEADNAKDTAETAAIEMYRKAGGNKAFYNPVEYGIVEAIMIPREKYLSDKQKNRIKLGNRLYSFKGSKLNQDFQILEDSDFVNFLPLWLGAAGQCRFDTEIITYEKAQNLYRERISK